MRVRHYSNSGLRRFIVRPETWLLLGRAQSNASYGKIFSEVCSQKVENDGLSFVSDKIRVETIRDDEAYEDLRLLLEARLANARIPLQIDIGFGDPVVPAPEEVEYPTLLNFPSPKLHAYPRENVIAEMHGRVHKRVIRPNHRVENC